MTTPQAPIGSGFTAASTTADVIKGIDLTGRTAIVTGGYSGIGTETVRVLRAAGAHVIVPTRDRARATMALANIDGVEIATMDLLDPASIDTFARQFLDSGRALHILVNNAGIMANPLTRDARGYESQFATNHLGHFQLVNRLWPALRQADGARVVSVSSWGHRFSTVDFEDPDFERRAYDPVHGLKTIAQGAATSVWAATSPRLDGLGGVYCEDVEVAALASADQADNPTIADSLTKRGVMPYAVDPASADRLWKLSETLI